ncbi:MAG: hypothetical protein RDV41_09035 [Planctomycetota bacterium]|nr:hypothetical protein [Planctomycetota bacterium]
MKTVVAIVMTLVLASLIGCTTSDRGGSRVEDQGFKISVPMFDTSVKQGELETITVTVERDPQFKQDVRLQFDVTQGISLEPSSYTIRASDKPDLQVRIRAPKDAALGEYPIKVRGTPETGDSTSVGFTVKVVAP